MKLRLTEFVVIVENTSAAFLVSEKTFEEIMAEIKDLRRKLIAVRKSDSLKFELLQKICDLYNDPSAIFVGPRKV